MYWAFCLSLMSIYHLPPTPVNSPGNLKYEFCLFVFKNNKTKWTNETENGRLHLLQFKLLSEVTGFMFSNLMCFSIWAVLSKKPKPLFFFFFFLS